MRPGAQTFRSARERSGFTLIELLVVIAIIALLAAILFPVMGAVRENVRQGQCMGNMKALIQAAQLYKEDYKVYPDALFGIDPTGTGSSFGTRLYPEYVKSADTFTCPNSMVKWQQGTPIPTVLPVNRMSGATETYALAAFSSYDVQYRPNVKNPPANTAELHYTKKWTTGTAGLADASGNGQRQLIYRNPPDSTVVTWCLYHTNMRPDGSPSPNTMALVGFLSGNVQKIPADRMVTWGAAGSNPWEITPKP